MLFRLLFSFSSFLIHSHTINIRVDPILLLRGCSGSLRLFLLLAAQTGSYFMCPRASSKAVQTARRSCDLGAACRLPGCVIVAWLDAWAVVVWVEERGIGELSMM